MSKNHHKYCLDCKKSFFAKNIRAAYCSDKCRVRYNRRKSLIDTQNSPVLKSNDEILLNSTKELLEQKKQEIEKLSKEIESNRKILSERDTREKNSKIEKEKLLELRKYYIEKNGTRKSGGTVANAMFSRAKTTDDFLFGIAGIAIDNLIGNKLVNFDYTKEIKVIDEKLSQKPKIFLGTYHILVENPNNKRKLIEQEIIELQLRCEELENTIARSYNTKNLEQLKDADGFVSAKDIKHINFSDRIVLSGDLGVFVGALEKNKCAITLTGKQGSGKTYFSFDLISKFIQINYKVAYFSCEEGITQLTKEKIEYYNLQNEDNFKIAEEANLDMIKKSANSFDVMVIDSWGKLNADISEFDKLRIAFPNTIFVSIFQLTTSGQMRGGTMAAFDAGINIETSIIDGKRIAICTKNRYGKTGVKYFTDDRIVEKNEN